MTKKEAILLFVNRWYEFKTPLEIVEFQLYEEKLCMPFNLFHGAVEKVLGRPVYTHEFAEVERLREEFQEKKETLDIQEPEKTVMDTETNTKAVYEVIQNGEPSYFYTEYAGGFSYPYAAEQSILAAQEELRDTAAKEIMTELRGNRDYPQESWGKRLFQELGEQEQKEYEACYAQSGSIPFKITLDLDSQEIGFIFNQNCEEVNTLPNARLPLYGSVNEYAQLQLAGIICNYLENSEQRAHDMCVLRTYHDTKDYFSMFRKNVVAPVNVEAIYKKEISDYIMEQQTPELGMS